MSELQKWHDTSMLVSVPDPTHQERNTEESKGKAWRGPTHDTAPGTEGHFGAVAKLLKSLFCHHEAAQLQLCSCHISNTVLQGLTEKLFP